MNKKKLVIIMIILLIGLIALVGCGEDTYDLTGKSTINITLDQIYEGIEVDCPEGVVSNIGDLNYKIELNNRRKATVYISCKYYVVEEVVVSTTELKKGIINKEITLTPLAYTTEIKVGGTGLNKVIIESPQIVAQETKNNVFVLSSLDPLQNIVIKSDGYVTFDIPLSISYDELRQAEEEYILVKSGEMALTINNDVELEREIKLEFRKLYDTLVDKSLKINTESSKTIVLEEKQDYIVKQEYSNFSEVAISATIFNQTYNFVNLSDLIKLPNKYFIDLDVETDVYTEFIANDNYVSDVHSKETKSFEIFTELVVGQRLVMRQLNYFSEERNYYFTIVTEENIDTMSFTQGQFAKIDSLASEIEVRLICDDKIIENSEFTVKISDQQSIVVTNGVFIIEEREFGSFISFSIEETEKYKMYRESSFELTHQKVIYINMEEKVSYKLKYSVEGQALDKIYEKIWDPNTGERIYREMDVDAEGYIELSELDITNNLYVLDDKEEYVSLKSQYFAYIFPNNTLFKDLYDYDEDTRTYKIELALEEIESYYFVVENFYINGLNKVWYIQNSYDPIRIEYEESGLDLRITLKVKDLKDYDYIALQVHLNTGKNIRYNLDLNNVEIIDGERYLKVIQEQN